MIKDIKFNGYTAAPSDYECPDGSLAASLNLISEDSQVKPLPQPSVGVQLPPDTTNVFIHKVSDTLHNYIIVKRSTLSYFTAENGTIPASPTYHNISTNSVILPDISRIHTLGNTLIAFCADGMHYFLWKKHDNTHSYDYEYLGTHIPECALSFGLTATMERSEPFDVGDFYVHAPYNKIDFTGYDDTKVSVTNQVLAQVNKFIADKSTKKGRFIFPFFVRYAYRMYDGSLYMHSAPVLMIPSTGITPRAFIGSFTCDGENSAYVKKFNDCRIAAPTCSLNYALVSDNLPQLEKWSDIIKSVDIFVSAPIYTYDQSGEVESAYKSVETTDDYDKVYGVSYSCLINQALGCNINDFPLIYGRRNISDMYMMTFRPSDITRYVGGYISLPGKDADKVKDDIRDCSNFFFLRAIELSKLSAQRSPIEVKDDYLQSLSSRELMTDDYDSHDTLIPQYAEVYNSRLNIANLRKILFGGYHPQSLFTFTNGYLDPHKAASGNQAEGNFTHRFRVQVYINQDGHDIVVSHDQSISGSASFGLGYDEISKNPHNPFLFFYYPNPHAYKAVIYPISMGFDEPNEAITLTLEPHATLNGAFYFNGWDTPGRAYHYPRFNPANDTSVSLGNKIYTSQVNNPFLFPVTGINTIGTGIIRGISTAAKALSQGQFGQFPLYAFTTEGVWALEVSPAGTYIARQPITRDVILDNTTPLQMDNSVLFATDRGIMLISGSSTQCLSDIINNQTPIDLTQQLPALDTLHSMLNLDQGCSKTIHPFASFIRGCSMLYDYPHQRVIIYNKEYTYAYVLSLISQQWGMMYSTINFGLNSYPEALAVDRDLNLLNFSLSNLTFSKGLLVTRPIKLETPDILKTIDTAIVRGNFASGKVQTALYGSRDLIHWHLVWSSKDQYLRGFRGTPYKYFRVACVTDLSGGESLFGTTFQFTPRLNDQPR